LPISTLKSKKPSRIFHTRVLSNQRNIIKHQSPLLPLRRNQLRRRLSLLLRKLSSKKMTLSKSKLKNPQLKLLRRSKKKLLHKTTVAVTTEAEAIEATDVVVATGNLVVMVTGNPVAEASTVAVEVKVITTVKTTMASLKRPVKRKRTSAVVVTEVITVAKEELTDTEVTEVIEATEVVTENAVTTVDQMTLLEVAPAPRTRVQLSPSRRLPRLSPPLNSE